jgi:hypothetical protein
MSRTRYIYSFIRSNSKFPPFQIFIFKSLFSSPSICLETKEFNILLSCHKLIVPFNLLFLKQRNSVMIYNLSHDLIGGFISYFSVPHYLNTGPQSPREMQRYRVWLYKGYDLWMAGKFYRIWKARRLYKCQQKLIMLAFPRNGRICVRVI